MILSGMEFWLEMEVQIGMGAVVVKNIPKNESWAGNPTKKM